MFLPSFGLVAGLLLPSVSAGILGRHRAKVQVQDPDCLVEIDVAATIYEQPVAVSTHIDTPTIITVGPGATLIVGPDRVPTDIDTVVTILSTHMGTRTHTYTINRTGSGITRTTIRTIRPANPSSTVYSTLTTTSFASFPTTTGYSSSSRPYPPPISSSATVGPPQENIVTLPYLGSVTTTLTLTSGSIAFPAVLTPATVSTFTGPTASDVYYAGYDGSTTATLTVLPSQFGANTALAFSTGAGLVPFVNTRLAGAGNGGSATLIIETPTTTFSSTASITEAPSSTSSTDDGVLTLSYFGTTATALRLVINGVTRLVYLVPATVSNTYSATGTTTIFANGTGTAATTFTVVPTSGFETLIVEGPATALEPPTSSSSTESFPTTSASQGPGVTSPPGPTGSTSAGPFGNTPTWAYFTGTNTSTVVLPYGPGGTPVTFVLTPATDPAFTGSLASTTYTVGYNGSTATAITIVQPGSSQVGFVVVETPNSVESSSSSTTSESSSISTGPISEFSAPTSSFPGALNTLAYFGDVTEATLTATRAGTLTTFVITPVPTPSNLSGIDPTVMIVAGYNGTTTRSLTILPTATSDRGTLLIETPISTVSSSTTTTLAPPATWLYIGDSTDINAVATYGGGSLTSLALEPTSTPFSGVIDPFTTYTIGYPGPTAKTVTILPNNNPNVWTLLIETPTFTSSSSSETGLSSSSETSSPSEAGPSSLETSSTSTTSNTISFETSVPATITAPPTSTSSDANDVVTQFCVGCTSTRTLVATVNGRLRTLFIVPLPTESASLFTQGVGSQTLTAGYSGSTRDTITLAPTRDGDLGTVVVETPFGDTASSTETTVSETSESSTPESPTTTGLRTQGYIGGDSLQTITPTVNGTATPVFITPVQSDFAGPFVTYTPTIGYDGQNTITLTLLPAAGETAGTIVVETPTALSSESTLESTSSSPSITGVPSPTNNDVPYVTGTDTTFVSATMSGATYTFTLVPATTTFNGPVDPVNTYTIGGPSDTTYTIVPTGTQSEGTIVIQTATDTSLSIISETSTSETSSPSSLTTASPLSTAANLVYPYLTGSSVLLVPSTISGSSVILTLTPATVSTYNGAINTDSLLSVGYSGSTRTTLTVLPTDPADDFATGFLVVETPTLLSTVVTNANTRIIPYYTGTDTFTLVYSSGSLVGANRGSATATTGTGAIVPTRLASALAGATASPSNPYTTYYLTPGTASSGYTGPVGGQTTFTLSCQGTTTTQYTVPPTDPASPTGTLVTASPCTYTTAIITTTVGYSGSTTSTYTVSPDGPASTGDQTISVIVETPIEGETSTSESSISSDTITSISESGISSDTITSTPTGVVDREYVGGTTSGTITVSGGNLAGPTVINLVPATDTFTGPIDPSNTLTGEYPGTVPTTVTLLPLSGETDGTILVELPTAISTSDTTLPTATDTGRQYIGDTTTGVVTAFSGVGAEPTYFTLAPATVDMFTGPIDPSVTYTAPYNGTDTKTLILFPTGTDTAGTSLLEVPTAAANSDTITTSAPSSTSGRPYAGDSVELSITATLGPSGTPTGLLLTPATESLTYPVDPTNTFFAPYGGITVKTLTLYPTGTESLATYLFETPTSTASPSITASPTGLAGIPRKLYVGDTTSGIITAFPNGETGLPTTISLDPYTGDVTFTGPYDPSTTLTASYDGTDTKTVTILPDASATYGTLLVEVPSFALASATSSSAAPDSTDVPYDGDTTTGTITATPFTVVTESDGSVSTAFGSPTTLALVPATAPYDGPVDPAATLATPYDGSTTRTLTLHPTGSQSLGTVVLEIPTGATASASPSSTGLPVYEYNGGDGSVQTVTAFPGDSMGPITGAMSQTFIVTPAATQYTGSVDPSTTLTAGYTGSTTQTLLLLPNTGQTAATVLVETPVATATESPPLSGRLYQGDTTTGTVTATPFVNGASFGSPTVITLDPATTPFTGQLDPSTTLTAQYDGLTTMSLTLYPAADGTFGTLLVEVPSITASPVSAASTSPALTARLYQFGTSSGTFTATLNGSPTVISLEPATTPFTGSVDDFATFTALYDGTTSQTITVFPESGSTLGTLMIEVPSITSTPASSTESSTSSPAGRLYQGGGSSTDVITITPTTTGTDGLPTTAAPTSFSIDPASSAFTGEVDPATLTATYTGSTTQTLTLFPSGSDSFGTVVVEVPESSTGSATVSASATITAGPTGTVVPVVITRLYQGGTTTEVATITPTTTGTDGIATTGDPTILSLDPATSVFTGGVVSGVLTAPYSGSTTATVTLLPTGTESLGTLLVNVPVTALAAPSTSASAAVSSSAAVTSSAAVSSSSVSLIARLFQGGSAPSTLTITPAVVGQDGKQTTGAPTVVSLDIATSTFTGSVDPATTYTATYPGPTTQIITLQPDAAGSFGTLIVEVPETAAGSSTTSSSSASLASTLDSRLYVGDTTSGVVTATPVLASSTSPLPSGFSGAIPIGPPTTISISPAATPFTGPVDPQTTFTGTYPGTTIKHHYGVCVVRGYGNFIGVVDFERIVKCEPER
ncbi:uncharacterized protein BKCO1_7000169 [Diplodia corticola]|uniref:Uncharacterized protein n=1 Tax=Diplodia corticola TaxID=236234 RepID=A0A1J9R7C6_9PEZI|nr:uncharacterized protein BKCO1_7000169 [Diplodia corticola]OJD37430.1 hypothetical protein BKCO1_7000169 [Diplodia corticola]